jgi:hypothetical protein
MGFFVALLLRMTSRNMVSGWTLSELGKPLYHYLGEMDET